MRLYQTEKWSNPYSIDCNGEKKLSNILFFNRNEVVVEVGRGWFGNNNTMPELIIDCDCVVKRKVDYTCKTAFLISLGKYYDGIRYALYIPIDVMGFEKSIVASKGSYVFYVAERMVSKKYNVSFETRHYADRLLHQINYDSKDCIETLDISKNNAQDVANKIFVYQKAYNEELTKLNAMTAEEMLNYANTLEETIK